MYEELNMKDLENYLYRTEKMTLINKRAVKNNQSGLV